MCNVPARGLGPKALVVLEEEAARRAVSLLAAAGTAPLPPKAQAGALDFAGGIPVEMASGFSALAAALVVGARKDYGRQALLPHNAMYVLLGAGLLWFGWFGFNSGSALAANGIAALAFTTTMLAPMATLLVWTVLDAVRTGKPTAVGAEVGELLRDEVAGTRRDQHQQQHAERGHHERAGKSGCRAGPGRLLQGCMPQD